MIASTENQQVDFKRDVSGVKSIDLVAFANTEHGGTLLIGVDEYTTSAGVQRGKVVGCSVDDNARLTLINKALECYPPLQIQLITENLSAKPFLRLEIPSCDNRPYCNSRGTYSIRAQGRNRALYPEELLRIFLASESDLFSSRFSGVAQTLEEQVSDISAAMNAELNQVSAHIDQLDRQLKTAYSRIGQLTDSTKKRSRSLLQSIKDNQQSLAMLTRAVSDDESALQHSGHLELIEQRLEFMISLLMKSE
ncbi:MAG: helix-turn-helix domain-containing protein [Pseudomonadales bacterium]